jgi:hypothetical protein
MLLIIYAKLMLQDYLKILIVSQIHFLISDNFNLLLNTLDKKNSVYRLLIPITHSQYNAVEISSISLLGHTGFCNWFNFTRNGILEYIDYTKRNFKIRDFLIPTKILGKSTIHKHQQLWFECIYNFVSK